MKKAMKSVDFNPFAGGEILRVSPSTAPQREIIASAQMSDTANTAFNQAVSLRVQGPLDAKLLQQCFTALIERHDILRATFSRRGDEICLAKALDFKLTVKDLKAQDAAAQQREITDLWKHIANAPMNLEEGPLFFAWLLQLAEDRHELVIAAHHVICDGWSFSLLLKDLAALYSAGGSTVDWPAAPSFFDFAETHEARQADNTDINYWLDKFQQVPPTLDLPLDKVRPPSRHFEATRHDFQANSELAETLPKAAGRLKVSLVNLVMAGYFALLHRLTGNEDIVVGLPVAGQAVRNRLGQVGHMVQLLPIRLMFNSDISFADLTALVKQEMFNALEHANFTFGNLVEKVQVDRTRVPLITTIFNIDQPMPVLAFGAARASVKTVPRSAENFEIFLNLTPTPDTLIFEASYSTALFSKATIHAWLEAFECLLTEVTKDASQKIGELLLCREVPAIAKHSNNTDRNIQFRDFISAFRAQVCHQPDAIAVISGKTRLSYAQLDQLSSQLANRLVRHGVSEGAIVGVCCQRSEKMLISAIAVLKLGAAYLPLDPDFPEDRLTYMLEDSGAIAVLEDARAPTNVRAAPITHIAIDHLESIAMESSELPELEVNPQRLSYLIYTSGSTGKPKGVRVHTEAMINFLESMAQTPGCETGDRLLAVTTLSFDISVLELYLPLITGACCVIANREDLKDGDKLSALVEQHKVSILQATPSTWRMLLASRWKASSLTHPRKLKALCGGETLPPNLAMELTPHVAELWNMFGPTETCVWSSCKNIQDDSGLVTIGTPIANTRIYILSPDLQPLPLSVPGELCIGGKGVTLGYHNRPELTSEKFVNHPLFGRIYRTGDLARLLPNGEIQHLGRLDDQIKLRGYRIELGEIESALTACEEVSAAAVYLWELSANDTRIVACCVPTEGSQLASTQIRKQLRERLPQYMVPQYLMPVEKIPMTPNNKVDRRALPRPEITESNLLSHSTLNNDTEKLLAQIWTDLIHPKNPIGRDDNFFEVGGHSLLALEFIRKTETATGKRLTASEIVTEQLWSLAEKVLAATDAPTKETDNSSTLVKEEATPARPPTEKIQAPAKQPLWQRLFQKRKMPTIQTLLTQKSHEPKTPTPKPKKGIFTVKSKRIDTV